jgi:threonine dehydrogenase-like Zn-dependent dehydrogenase
MGSETSSQGTSRWTSFRGIEEETAMRALTWQGIEDVKVTEVPDPRIQEPTDAVVRVTSTAICGSDLHLYKVLAAYLTPGDVLGHEFMGIVEEVGSGVTNLQVGDRVVVPFNISCGHCWMCSRGLFAQCETTQNRDQGKGASLFGYTSLYGAVPGGQAERVRVPHADFGPVKLPSEMPDERFLYLSDILPTAWQGLKYADVPAGGSITVLGLGPVGQLAVRAARQQGIEQVIGVDLVPDRLAKAEAAGAHVIDLSAVGDVADAVRDLTDGRGTDGVLEAVGMEAHGSPIAEMVIGMASRLPKVIARPAIEKVGIDRLNAIYTALDAVRRGGTVSISGVYGGAADPLPMMDMFDKGLTLKMGQCHVKQWTDELMDIVNQPEDVLGLESLATHRVSLDEAPEMYKTFQEKSDGCLKVVLTP